jgi:transposase-like protein
VAERRRWPVEVRLRILDEVLQAGASMAAVAGRNGVSRGLVYQWLRQVREGRMHRLSNRMRRLLQTRGLCFYLR